MRRGTEQGVRQRLVVCEEGKLLSFQEETEMTNGRISNQQFSVEGRVLGLGGRELLGVEATSFCIHRRTWSNEEMMTDSMTKFRGLEAVNLSLLSMSGNSERCFWI